MRNTICMLSVVFVLILGTGSAGAQMMGGDAAMMQQPAEQNRGAMQQPDNGSYMMYPNMMMGGYGPGSCLNNGYGMGTGMMSGYGMGSNHHGAMMRGYGTGPGMRGFSSPSQYNDFMDATKELRRKMHSLRFEYGEMMRDPKTTMGDLQKKEREMFELQKQIFEKMAK